jgi:hypothetical protein
LKSVHNSIVGEGIKVPDSLFYFTIKWKYVRNFRIVAISKWNNDTKVLSQMDDILIYTWVICNKITANTLQTRVLYKKIGWNTVSLAFF